MESIANICKAIIEVMKEVKGIEKSMTVGNGSNSYKGVPDQEVKKIIGDAMTKHGLCIIPTGVTPRTEVSKWEESYNGQVKNKQSVFTEVQTKYLLIHESGESLELSGLGHGVDPQDKGAGKATTYALKYTLLYTFLVPTGKIDDAEATHSDAIETAPPKKQIIGEKQFTDLLKRINNGEKGLIEKALEKFQIPQAQLTVLKTAEKHEPVNN